MENDNLIRLVAIGYNPAEEIDKNGSIIVQKGNNKPKYESFESLGGDIIKYYLDENFEHNGLDNYFENNFFSRANPKLFTYFSPELNIDLQLKYDVLKKITIDDSLGDLDNEFSKKIMPLFSVEVNGSLEPKNSLEYIMSAKASIENEKIYIDEIPEIKKLYESSINAMYDILLGLEIIKE